ncbi:hypothetical protein DVS77_26005 [Mycolicibacterium moriokaense]|nr:hypothetical protein DVS77_26005 [Mycolicibacterium moriokaense]
MTSQKHWRRLIAGSAVAGALLAGVGAPVAIAAPGDDTSTETDAPQPTMTGPQALALLKEQYDTGAGGGQVSNFVHEIFILTNLGYPPSKSNQAAIVEALDKRPNQGPLVDALKATVSYQRRIQAQAAAQQSQGGQGMTIGGAPAPFDGGGGTIMGHPG